MRHVVVRWAKVFASRVQMLFAAAPLRLLQEVSRRLEMFNLGIVKGLHSYTAMIVINSPIQKTDQPHPPSYSIESTGNVEDRATVEMGYLKPEKKQLSMVTITKPDVMREIKYRSGSYISAQTFCLKRREQKENRNLWQYRALYSLEKL